MITTYAEPRFAPLPPAKGRNPKAADRIDWLAIGAQLQAEPGRWAAIGTIPGNRTMGNRGVRLAERGIETTLRSNGDGTATIWACYVGTATPITTPPMVVPAEVMAAWFEVAS